MARASGIHLTNKEAEVVLGMVNRGDRAHDIAAWFGVNQGRIAEVKDGSHGKLTMATAESLPPSGPPGIKGRRIHASVVSALNTLNTKGADGLEEAIKVLQNARERFDTNEA